MERGGNQRIAAKGKDHARGVNRAQTAIARPGLAKGGVWPDHQPRDPETDTHGENAPEHCQHDADLDRIIVILLQPCGIRRRLLQRATNCKKQATPNRQGHEAMHSHRILFAQGRHHQPEQGEADCKNETDAAFAEGKTRNHSQSPSSKIGLT